MSAEPGSVRIPSEAGIVPPGRVDIHPLPFTRCERRCSVCDRLELGLASSPYGSLFDSLRLAVGDLNASASVSPCRTKRGGREVGRRGRVVGGGGGGRRKGETGDSSALQLL